MGRPRGRPGLGILLTERNRLVAVDPDTPKAEDWATSMLGKARVPSFRGLRGTKRIFRAPAGLTVTSRALEANGTVPAGVDIKGFRSVLVVPPTPGYTWLPSLEFGAAIPSEPPAKFLALLNGFSPKRKPRTKIPAGPIPPGQAHQAMLSAIGKLGRDRSLSSDELWTLARG